jgi:hypothetical protein
MPPPAVPDWLARHDGSLKSGIDGRTLFVLVGGMPLYRLEARPAGGKFVGLVVETVSGRPLGDGTKYETTDAALAGGLEALRNRLGW